MKSRMILAAVLCAAVLAVSVQARDIRTPAVPSTHAKVRKEKTPMPFTFTATNGVVTVQDKADVCQVLHAMKSKLTQANWNPAATEETEATGPYSGVTCVQSIAFDPARSYNNDRESANGDSLCVLAAACDEFSYDSPFCVFELQSGRSWEELSAVIDQAIWIADNLEVQ
jgi:hypothetical protein